MAQKSKSQPLQRQIRRDGEGVMPVRQLTARDLVGLKTPTEVAISADGTAIAIVASEPDWEAGEVWSHLWLWRDGELCQWTFGKERVSHPRFSPDGKWLAFLAQRSEPKDGAEPKAPLWLMPLNGGEPRAITDADEGVTAFAWHPDGTAIWAIIPEPKPDERKRAEDADRKRKRDYTFHDDELPRRALWRFRVPDGDGGKVFVGDAGIYEIAFSPDGNRLIFATTQTGKRDNWRRSKLFWLALDSAEKTPIALCDRAGAQFSPRPSPDGNFVAFLSWRNPERSFSHHRLFVADFEGNWREIASLPDLEVDELRWVRNGFCCLLQTGVTSQLWRLGERKAMPITDADWVITALDVTPDGKTFAAIRTDDQNPPDVWLGKDDGERVRWTKVSDFNPQVKSWRLPKAHLVQWRSEDGMAIEGVLWLASDEPRPPAPCPTVIWVHGGPKGRAMKALLSATGFPAFLAANGYAVLAPNFRGSGGYSDAFATANFCDLGGGDFRDILAGAEWCISQGITDPHRIGIAGGSYGGYMTNWALAHSERFKAGVSLFGIALLFSDFGNSDNPSWEPDYLGGMPWEATDLYLHRSPFVHAHRIRAPLLLLHGESDRNTFISNSQEMFTALKKLGRTVQFVRYPREGHGFREPYHRVDTLERTLRWFDRWLKGDAFASATPLGETAADDELQVCLTQVRYPVRWLNCQPSDGEGLVEATITLQAMREGMRVSLAKEIRLWDDEGREHPPLGIVQGEGENSFVVEGDLQVAVPKERSLPLRLAFRLPSDRHPCALQIRSLTLRCRS
jgi:dipeptidyl aminopeptidase/acylaminoacyl peptidase